MTANANTEDRLASLLEHRAEVLADRVFARLVVLLIYGAVEMSPRVKSGTGFHRVPMGKMTKAITGGDLR